jgi:DNA invertase Pin-like site-specific DNA recombinase
MSEISRRAPSPSWNAQSTAPAAAAAANSNRWSWVKFKPLVTRAKGVSLKATEQPIDTSTAAGKCFLDMLGVFAEFETNLRRERQLEGIAKAKAAGVYKGRPASIDAAKVRQMRAKGMGASEIAKALKIGRASVYRALGEPG